MWSSLWTCAWRSRKAAKKMHTTTVNPRVLSRPFFGQRHMVDEPIIFLWKHKQEKLNLDFSDLYLIIGTLKQARRILYAYGKSPSGWLPVRLKYPQNIFRNFHRDAMSTARTPSIASPTNGRDLFSHHLRNYESRRGVPTPHLDFRILEYPVWDTKDWSSPIVTRITKFPSFCTPTTCAEPILLRTHSH
jgi:hypothetical protein